MTVRARLIRPDDLLHLLVEVGNMRLDLADPTAPALVVEEPDRDAYLAIGFPPQAVVEEAVLDERQPTLPAEDPAGPFKRPEPPPAISKPAPEGIMLSRISGQSRLVFSVPADARIPYTFAGLLGWAGLEARLSPLAAAPIEPSPEEATAAGSIEAPGSGVTALELPYRLVLSPTTEARWIHRTELATSRGRTELWHTRLGRQVGDGVVPASREHPLPLRAIWSPDFPDPPAMGEPDQDWNKPGTGVLTSMTPRDRHEIVVLTSGYNGYLKGYNPWPTVDQNRYVPKPIQAENVILSALGGWLKSRGGWSPPMPWVPARRVGPNPMVPGQSLNISEWVHNATQGRDHYVRIVYEGVVHPFCHRASLIKITERKIRDRADGSPVAFLAQRMFVVIRQPVVDYDADRRDDPMYARRMPFRRVRLTTLITPDIDFPTKITKPPQPAGDTDPFWIEVRTAKFRFNAIAEDLTGRVIDFTTALVFIPLSSLGDANVLAAVRDSHLNAGSDRVCPVPMQPVTYADPLPDADTDNTTQVTEQLHFTSESVGAGPTLRFRPALLTSFVRLPAVEQLLGINAPTQITLRPEYVNQGFEATASGLFAYVAKETTPGTFIQATLGAAFSADQAGGVVTPDLSVSALTRAQGPVAGKDLGQLAAGDFNPVAFFADVASSAKVFGTFALTKLLTRGALEVGAPKVQMTTDRTDPARPKLVASLSFTPSLTSATVGIASFLPRRGASLTVTGRVERVLTAPGEPPAAARSDFRGVLREFAVDLANVVAINFASFSFHAASGSKPSVDVALTSDPIGFAGDLSFVNKLKEIIPPGLFGDGASLDVTPTGIRAGFSIGVPPVSIGVFSLENVSLGASVELPFADGKPLFDFGVSSREHPFCLTVAFLGGAGFFHLQIDTDGVRMLEASLEFGASASINLGVASGGVHIMAGIYFAMGTKNGVDFAILSGYLRMGGELSVLGLISISLEFVLNFGYEAGKAAGRATLTVKVEIAFFSKSVEISVEKKFGGSSGDPRFAQVIENPAVWGAYASAFA